MRVLDETGKEVARPSHELARSIPSRYVGPQRSLQHTNDVPDKVGDDGPKPDGGHAKTEPDGLLNTRADDRARRGEVDRPRLTSVGSNTAR